MTYRVRKQVLTGKLILQHDMASTENGGGKWSDAQEMPGEFALVPIGTYIRLIQERGEQAERIARYDRRAEAQRKAAQARAERAKTQEQQ